MGDSVTASAIPPGLDAYAGYVAGFVSFPEIVALHFPKSHCFSITPNVDHLAACLDCEAGDATPAQVPGWLMESIAHGQYRPCIYAGLDTNMPEVIRLLANVPRDHYRLWVADQNGTPHIPPGFDACQYDGSALRPELKYDLSLLVDDFFPAAKPKPPPAPTGNLHATLTLEMIDSRFGIQPLPHPGAKLATKTRRHRFSGVVDEHTGEWKVRRRLLSRK